MMVLVVLEGVVILIMAVLVVGLLRSHGEILRSLHELGVSEEGHHNHTNGGAQHPPDTQRPIAQPRSGSINAVDIIGSKPGGGAGTITLAGSQPTLLAFMSSGCAVCQGFWDDFAGRIDVPGGLARLVIVTKGADQESESAVAALAPSHHQLLMSSQAWADYDVPVSPYFILVAGSGEVAGEGAAMNWAQLSKLMSEATEDRKIQQGFRGRNSRVDDELSAAGIEPGHPSLYGDPRPEDDRR